MANVYKAFNGRTGRVASKHLRCGLKPWKVSGEAKQCLAKRLVKLRRERVCTATFVQQEAAAHLGLHLAPLHNPQDFARPWLQALAA